MLSFLSRRRLFDRRRFVAPPWERERDLLRYASAAAKNSVGRLAYLYPDSALTLLYTLHLTLSMTNSSSIAKCGAVVTGLVMLYSAARIAVQFLEALSIVQAQRAEDAELLEICRRGEARGSAKMRQACINAHADLASPLMFKAIVEAVGMAFAEFCESVGSPMKLGILVLFLISSVAMPVLPWARWLWPADANLHPAPLQGIHYMAYAPGLQDVAHRRSVRARFRGAVKRIRSLPRWRNGKGDGHDDDDLEECPELEVTTSPTGASDLTWTTPWANDCVHLKEE